MKRFTVCITLLVVGLVVPSVAGAANPTKLSIACTPKGLSPGVSSTCTATVTDAGPVASRIPPSGAVTFTVQETGTFDPPEGCSLEASGAFSSKCSVNYTPTAIDGGTHVLLGTYEGDDGHGRATAQFTLDVTPVNDELTNPTVIEVPGKTTGTTEGATFNYEDDPDLCSDAYGPVWYSLKPSASGRVAVRLTVRGFVDSVVAVFRQDRSKLTDLGCELTDVSGVAGVPFDAERGSTYLIAVAAPWDARVGDFTLETAVVPPVSFPGSRLVHDANVTLDPLLRPGSVFSARLRQGITYRIDASAPAACVHVAILQLSATSADRAIDRSGECTGYLVYTPDRGMGGVFPVVVSVDQGSATHVHVALRRAGADDLAPGVSLQNGEIRRGRLAARDADVVDVYRFRSVRTGDASLRLSGSVHADLLLLDREGKQLACACDGDRRSAIVRRLPASTYFVAVRARPGETGNYSIALRMRDPTTTGISLSGGKARKALTVTASFSRAVDRGSVIFELERFDPLTQWHFVSAAKLSARLGGTTLEVRPQLGGWRVRAQYLGTLSSSPSASAWIDFLVDPGAASGGGKSRRSCTPQSNLTFATGGGAVTCTSKGFSAAGPAAPTKTPAVELAELTALVTGIALLKDPFRTDLLADLDDASSALSDRKPEDASAKLGDFIAQVQAAPLHAELTSDQRNQLLDAATRIRSALTTTH